MVKPSKEHISRLKLRTRNGKSLYKLRLLYVVVTIIIAALVWSNASTFLSSFSLLFSDVTSIQKNDGPAIQLLSVPKCQHTQRAAHDRKRWSDRLPSRSISTVQSIFNCDLSDSTCQYYFPGNFFDEGCGIGRSFAHYITDAESMRKNNTLWANMPSVGFPSITMDKTCLNISVSSDEKRSVNKGIPGWGPPGRGKPNRQRRQEKEKLAKALSTSILSDIGEHLIPSTGLRCLTERISFIHVHKSGGTSLHRGFDNIRQRYNNATITRHKWFTPRSDEGRGMLSNKEAARTYNFTLESTLQATTYPVAKFGEHDHVIFAVVRDPIDRFISSIGQAMGGEGSQRNKIGEVLQKECIKSTSALTLTCMARYVRDHGFWIELHFSPQVIDISFTTIWQDVPIAIFPFKELKSILTYLGLPKYQGRDGSSERYRPDPVLSEMTVEDYDDESLRIVCEIYKVDVIMQRSVGIEVPRCDPFIPR